jgi:hypothetical protein
MGSFSEFLHRLLVEGSVVLDRPPQVGAADRAAGVDLLAAAFADHRLDVAGPPPAFDADAAAASAELVWLACWFLVHRGDEPAVMEKALAFSTPGNASQHLSADLTLRFLPQVHRRARGLAVGDPLSGQLARVLRAWPLSGVLSDVAEPPTTPLEFNGHSGLLMLYAERLATNVKPAWMPAGRGLEYVELAFAERGVRMPSAASIATAPTEM